MKKTIATIALLVGVLFIGSIIALPVMTNAAQLGIVKPVAASTKQVAVKSVKPVTAPSNIVREATIDKTQRKYYGLDDELKGDMNGDNSINVFDIDLFTMVYNYPWFFQQHHPNLFWRADIDNDNDVDYNDVNLFVQLLMGR